MTIAFEPSERFREAAAQWSDQRMKSPDDAFEEKVEQALLEIENLVADATEVEFRIEDGTVYHEPSDAVEEFLATQAEEADVDEATLLRLHVDLFARVFLDSEQSSPPGAPPT